uniref:Uncharacterized protein n=1 Tax=Anguilla anguilla TaxID=7936 RepID=A0A0E9PM87_ANGAN
MYLFLECTHPWATPAPGNTPCCTQQLYSSGIHLFNMDKPTQSETAQVFTFP